MTCPTCDTLRAELQRAREAWARLRPFLPLKGSGPQWEHSEHYRAAKDVDAALSSTPPPCKHDKGREILANGVKGLERCLDCGVYLEATPPRALCTKCGKGHSAPGWCEAEEATQQQEFVQSLAPPSTAQPQGPEHSGGPTLAEFHAEHARAISALGAESERCLTEYATTLDQPPSTICGLCGEKAKGYAFDGRTRLCHPDEGQDCYVLWTVHKQRPAPPQVPDTCEVCGREKGHP